MDDPSAYEDWEEEADEVEEPKEDAETVPEPPDILTGTRSNSGSVHRPMGISDQEGERVEETNNQEALATMMGSLNFTGEGQISNQNLPSTQGEVVESPTLPNWQGGSDGLLSRRTGSSTAPLNINPPGSSSQRSENRPPNSGDSGRATPSGIGSATENVAAEGPMTPRNDAGPFVFDGSAGRAAGRILADNLSQDSIEGNSEGRASVRRTAYDVSHDSIDGNSDGRASVQRIADDRSQHSID